MIRNSNVGSEREVDRGSKVHFQDLVMLITVYRCHMSPPKFQNYAAIEYCICSDLEQEFFYV